jgi:hypothetical protein
LGLSVEFCWLLSFYASRYLIPPFGTWPQHLDLEGRYSLFWLRS